MGVLLRTRLLKNLSSFPISTGKWWVSSFQISLTFCLCFFTMTRLYNLCGRDLTIKGIGGMFPVLNLSTIVLAKMAADLVVFQVTSGVRVSLATVEMVDLA